MIIIENENIFSSLLILANAFLIIHALKLYVQLKFILVSLVSARDIYLGCLMIRVM